MPHYMFCVTVCVTEMFAAKCFWMLNHATQNDLNILFMQTGRVVSSASKICGHRGPVTDIKWNPFDDSVIASGSDDTTVSIIHICV